MNYKLIIRETPILCSDEVINRDDKYFSMLSQMVYDHDYDDQKSLSENDLKVIAGGGKGLDLPRLDLYSLSEEDFKKIGLVNAKKIGWEKYPRKIYTFPVQTEKGEFPCNFDENENERIGFIEGIEYAQSFINKKFTIEDIEKAMIEGLSIETFWEKYLSEPKVFDVEIEMMLQKRWGTEWVDLPNQKEGQEPDGIYRNIPNTTYDSIKVLKVL